MGRSHVTSPANGVHVGALDIDEASVHALRGEIGDRRDRSFTETRVIPSSWPPCSTPSTSVGAASTRWSTCLGALSRRTSSRTTPRDGRRSCARISSRAPCVPAGHPPHASGRRGGSIVNLTTIECHRAAPGFAVYAAAKAAVEQFGRTLAVELGPDGIRVNNVAPDYTPTPNMIRIAGDSPARSPRSDAAISIPWDAKASRGRLVLRAVPGVAPLVVPCTGSTLHADGGTYAASGWFNWPGQGWRNGVPEEVLRELAPHAGPDGGSEHER